MLEAIQQEMVEISHEIQDEVVARIIDLIRHERKRRSLWNRLKVFFSRFKKCSCMCGVSGIGCECEQIPPPQVIPSVVKIKSEGSGSKLQKHDAEAEHNQSGLRKRSSIAYV